MDKSSDADAELCTWADESECDGCDLSKSLNCRYDREQATLAQGLKSGFIPSIETETLNYYE
jgi:hypothetical protein